MTCDKNLANDSRSIRDRKDSANATRFCEGIWEEESAYAKAYMRSRNMTSKVLPQPKKAETDPQVKRFLTGENALITRIAEGAKNYDKEFQDYQEALNKLLKSRYRYIAQRRTLSRIQIERMAKFAREWKRQNPEGTKVPRELLFRSISAASPIRQRIYRREGGLEIPTFVRDLRTITAFNPHAPKLTFMRSGISAEGREISPPIIDSGWAGQLYEEWDDWFEMTELELTYDPWQDESYILDEYAFKWDDWKIRTTVKDGQGWGSTVACIYFTTTIDIEEEGSLALYLKSRATMKPGAVEKFLEEVPINFHCTHKHEVHVTCEKPGGVERILSPDFWGELAFSHFFADTETYKDHPYIDMTGEVLKPGPNAEVPDGRYWSDPIIMTSRFGHALYPENLYIYALSGSTTVEGDFPTLRIFCGPCKIRIIEKVRYWWHIRSWKNGNGGVMEYLQGWLEPLNWSLYKIDWFGRNLPGAPRNIL